MHDVFGEDGLKMSCRTPQAKHPAQSGGTLVCRFGYLLPALVAMIFAMVIMHLLVKLVLLLNYTDSASFVSVLIGMVLVLVTLMPFVVLFASRARSAWLTASRRF